MKKIILIIGSLLVTFLLFSKYEAPFAEFSEHFSSFYLGGIQINEANNEDWMAMLKKAKMNTVEVTVYAKQGNWDSDSLQFDEKDDGVLNEIRAAKAAGIKVVLIMRVALDHAFVRNRFRWHGMIMPKNNPLLDRWFYRYGLFVEKWAKIAQEEGVDVFSIGSEMNALSATMPIHEIPKLYSYYNSLPEQNKYEKRVFKFKSTLKKEDLWVRGNGDYSNLANYINDRIKNNYTWGQQVTFAPNPLPKRLKLMNDRRTKCREHWKNIIKNVRTKFEGKLTYAANFDNYMEVDFWQELDFIGINAYFGLRSADRKFLNEAALLGGLKKGWERVFNAVNSFRKQEKLLEKPLLFTELGYINRENTTIEPWAGFGFSVVGKFSTERLIIWDKEKESLLERQLAVDALYDVVKTQNINLEGILYWKLTTHDYHLPYEPFALHLTPDAKDKLQESLAKFVSN